MTDLEMLLDMFQRTGVRATHDARQSKIGSAPGSSIVVIEQPPGFLNRVTWYVIFDIGPNGELCGMQVNQ